MKRYGIPYQGSKNLIAEWVVENLPGATHFYDLFAGGCSITHCAMLSGKYKTFTANDIDPQLPQFFLDAVNGKYRDERAWISREEFERRKASDPYVRYIWSFGNNGRGYLYSRELEPIKRAYWHAMFSDTVEDRRRWMRVMLKEISAQASAALKRLNFVRSSEFLGKLNDAENAVDEVRTYLRDALAQSGLTSSQVCKHLGNFMGRHYFSDSQWELPTEENYAKLQEVMPALVVPYETLSFKVKQLKGLQSLQSLESLQRLQSLERLESLQSLERLERLQSLERLESLQSLERLESLQSLESLESLESLQSLQIAGVDYSEVEIKPDSVIYCDIPYRNTAGYGDGSFDHERFYDWACAQTEPVFISEMWMPEDRFVEVASRQKFCTLQGGAKSKRIERLFRPRSQV